MSVYALVVGIDRYLAGLRPLHGAREDAVAIGHYLTSRVPADRLNLLSLLDEQATKQAVTEALRHHLGRAGSGDSALFWFCGHGSDLPVPPVLAHLESTRRLQTLVCADSRTGGVTDLVDKEVAVLVGEIARRGVHTAVVLDCCHSQSGSRLGDQAADAEDTTSPLAFGIRRVDTPDHVPDAEALFAGLGGAERAAELLDPARPGGAAAEHVALAACLAHQSAYELPFAAGRRGVFSHALLEQLERLGPASTYRELVAAVRCSVENLVPGQIPVLEPADPEAGLADQPFLGGELRRPAAPLTMRWVAGSWEVDAGACHGMIAGLPDDRTLIGVVQEKDAAVRELREAQVTRVLPAHSRVEPLGWEPDPRCQYPVVVTSVPLPPTPVAIGGRPGEDERTAALMSAAVLAATPGGRPSCEVRVADDDPGVLAELRVAVPRPRVVRIHAADGSALLPEAPCATPDEAAQVVLDLDHVARWRRIKALDNPVTGLAGAVRIEVAHALPGETVDPRNRPALPTDATGSLTLRYQRDAAKGWLPPRVFVRLRNTTDRDLYCVLLDLTERFRIHARLFDGGMVAAHFTASVARGGAIRLTVPPDKVVPGGQAVDWFKVLVCEAPFGATSFNLPPLGAPESRAAPPSPPAGGFQGALERLGFLALHRDAEAAADYEPACDWATAMLRVVTQVPDGRRSCPH